MIDKRSRDMIQGLVNMQASINSKISNEISDALRWGYPEGGIDGIKESLEKLLEEHFRIMKQ